MNTFSDWLRWIADQFEDHTPDGGSVDIYLDSDAYDDLALRIGAVEMWALGRPMSQIRMPGHDISLTLYPTQNFEEAS